MDGFEVELNQSGTQKPDDSTLHSSAIFAVIGVVFGIAVSGGDLTTSDVTDFYD